MAKMLQAPSLSKSFTTTQPLAVILIITRSKSRKYLAVNLDDGKSFICLRTLKGIGLEGVTVTKL